MPPYRNKRRGERKKQKSETVRLHIKSTATYGEGVCDRVVDKHFGCSVGDSVDVLPMCSSVQVLGVAACNRAWDGIRTGDNASIHVVDQDLVGVVRHTVYVPSNDKFWVSNPLICSNLDRCGGRGGGHLAGFGIKDQD